MKKHKDKKKLGVILVSAFIVFSMVISIFAIVVDNQGQDSNEYNKHKILFTNSGYKTKINGNYQEFYNHPTELERINISSNIISKLKNGIGIAFLFNPNESVTENLQYIDVVRYDAGLQFDKSVYFGITSNSSNYQLPIISCANATAEYPFIMINISSTTGFSISEENPNCIIMNGKLKDILASKDRLVYTYYGVMTSTN
jgi:hypothetical protein